MFLQVTDFLFFTLLDYSQELRKSLEHSVSLQRKHEDCSSDEYDSIEEDVLSEPEDQALAGHPGHDSVQKDIPEDRGTEGCPSQGPDTLVVLEFNPASKSELCLTWHFFGSGVSESNSRT